jgi:hypothetical protein
VAATTLAGSLCALAVVGGSQIQGASGSTDVSADATPTPIYKDPSYSFQERASDLVSRMTTAVSEEDARTEREFDPKPFGDAVYEITNGHQYQPPGWTRPLNPIERNGYAMASGEDHDRTALQLPGAQNQPIQQVSAANPKTIVSMETVGPIDVTPFESSVPAMLYSSYDGMGKG